MLAPSSMPNATLESFGERRRARRRRALDGLGDAPSTASSASSNDNICSEDVAEVELLASTALSEAKEATQLARAAKRAEIEAKVAAARLQQAVAAAGSRSAPRAVKESDLFSLSVAAKVEKPKHEAGVSVKATRLQADFGEKKFIKP